VRHALHLAPFGELSEPRALVEIAVAAEAAGWDAVFLWDHVLRPAEETTLIGDAWISLAAMAAVTSRIRLGPMVTPITRRRPAKLARETVALDRLSGGRLTLGLGLGVDSGGELSRFGEVLDPVERGDRLDEGAELLLRLWSGEEVNHAGPHFRAEGVRFRPGPADPAGIPLWFAARGSARRPVRRAARLGTGIHAIDMDADQVAAMLAVVRAERGSLDGFDVALEVEPGGDAAGIAAQGATWAMHAFGPSAPVDEVMAVIDRGP
jgi:alkanesulfonate monooxygenase SsuD/methylene tetrahydromethanopterin reductase-like flavin-dependent oxidoreductase (luciferase family)